MLFRTRRRRVCSSPSICLESELHAWGRLWVLEGNHLVDLPFPEAAWTPRGMKARPRLKSVSERISEFGVGMTRKTWGAQLHGNPGVGGMATELGCPFI